MLRPVRATPSLPSRAIVLPAGSRVNCPSGKESSFRPCYVHDAAEELANRVRTRSCSPSWKGGETLCRFHNQRGIGSGSVTKPTSAESTSGD